MAREATIYVVEDDDVVRDSIRALLESDGLTVVDFASCADFLRHARPDGQSCIVLDVHMPGMSGLELLDRLRRENMSILVIVITGKPDPAIRRAVGHAGARLLVKPFAGSELVGAIEEVLRGGQLQ